MAAPTSQHEVTARKLSDTISGLWGKIKDTFQTKLTGQTAYSAKGTATTVPQITTNALGQVTGITEVTISGVTPKSHTHGNIQNGGTLNDTAAAAAGNDYVVIRDASDNKIQTSTIKGTDVADAVSKKHSHSTLTLSTTAQAYDGSHTLALPSSDPYTSARTPSSHASSGTTYGVGTTSNYGHVKLATGDMNGASGANGVACGKNHSHSQYGSASTLNSLNNAWESFHTNEQPYMCVTSAKGRTVSDNSYTTMIVRGIDTDGYNAELFELKFTFESGYAKLYIKSLTDKSYTMRSVSMTTEKLGDAGIPALNMDWAGSAQTVNNSSYGEMYMKTNNLFSGGDTRIAKIDNMAMLVPSNSMYRVFQVHVKLNIIRSNNYTYARVYMHATAAPSEYSEA